MSWATAISELNESTNDVFGESVDYESLDGLTTVAGITGVLYRDGEDGEGKFDMPTASVAAPGFGDKITDTEGVIWRVREAMQPDSGLTPLDLRSSDYFTTVTAEYYRDDTEVWATHTSGLIVLIEQSGSSEVLEPEDSRIIDQFTVRSQYLSSVTHKMRFKDGDRYLYVTGKQYDDSRSRYTEFECVEEEA